MVVETLVVEAVVAVHAGCYCNNSLIKPALEVPTKEQPGESQTRLLVLVANLSSRLFFRVSLRVFSSFSAM